MGKQTEIPCQKSKMTFEDKCLIKAHNELIAKGGKGIKTSKGNKGYQDTPLFKPDQLKLF